MAKKSDRTARPRLSLDADLRSHIEWLLDHVERNVPVKCPCCKQSVTMRKRPMTNEMARVLIAMYREDPHGWVHVQSLKHNNTPVARGGDATKLKHWGLIEGQQGVKDDGNPRNGYWRLTEAGRQFVEGRLTVPRRVHILLDTCYGKDGEAITIHDALGEGFNYQDLFRD